MKRVFITGIAGFIGFHTAIKYYENGWSVHGVDNFNDCYDPSLKQHRKDLLLEKDIEVVRMDIRSEDLYGLVKKMQPDLVIHLAAAAGVRASLEQPAYYIDNNIQGTQCLINTCEAAGVEDIIYASTSCVMEGNPLPWKEIDNPGLQLSPYGYTKLTNENQFHVSKIKNTVGVRFFTVYGPYGRPDMALFTFTKHILNDDPIIVYNNGNMKRDFTYIDDIVQGVWLVSQNMTRRDIYCLGNGTQVNLMDFISEIEKNLGKIANKDFQPRHPADALETWSDTTKIQRFGYRSATPIAVGVKNFVEWYTNYHKVKGNAHGTV
jgi:UDP-glucuronate 4-epimerase